MNEFYRPCKTKKLIKVLKKLGLKLTEGKRHTRAECVNNRKQTTIPRHRDIKREIVNSICNFLIEKDFDRNILRKLLK